MAQKNWAEWDGTAVGFDFAVAEQCAQYHECGSYVAPLRRHVLAVEYGDKAFHRACRNWSDTIAVVRRDVDLTPRRTPLVLTGAPLEDCAGDRAESSAHDGAR